MSARVWVIAAGASVVLHGAGLAAIALSTVPEEPPEQTIPKSQFSIEAAEVPRSSATPQTPQGDSATRATASSTAAQSGAIPQSKAIATSAPSEPLGPAPSQATPLAADTASVAPTLAATPKAEPAAIVVSARPALKAGLIKDATELASTSVSTSPVPSVAPVLTEPPPTKVSGFSVFGAPSAQRRIIFRLKSEASNQFVESETTSVEATLTKISTDRPVITAAATPITATIQQTASLNPAPSPAATIAPKPQIAPAAQTSGIKTAPSAPTLTPAPSTQPDSAQSAALPLPETAGSASLAWSGSDDAPVSATSLAAIAAFTQAGDLQAASAEVRDGIAGILASVPCSRLQTTFLPDTGELELRGHIPEDGLRGPVLAALQEQVGGAIALSDQLLILPRPQCGALSGIGDVGLPQSTEQLSDPAVIGEDGFARNYTYHDGERLRLDLTAPDYNAYIYVDYFAADGSVLHLQPNEIVPLEFAAAKSAQSVGRARDGKPFLELIIAAPFGQEIAAAFATSVPLYEGLRPLEEPAEPYLAFLKERVAEARATHPDFKGEWVYFFVSTKAN